MQPCNAFTAVGPFCWDVKLKSFWEKRDLFALTFMLRSLLICYIDCYFNY